MVAAAALLHASAAGRANAERGCLPPETSLPQAEIDSFIADPDELLLRYPAAGPPLSARVQRLAASDTAAVPALIALAKRAESAHLVAIGIGLGRASGNCTKRRPDLAANIARLVVADSPPGLRAVFSSEATVTKLALGAPADIGGRPAPGEPDRSGGEARPDADATPTLEAALKSRPPGFLLPSALGTPLAEPSQLAVASSTRAADQGSVDSSTTSAAVALAPLLGELEATTASAESFATFVAAAGPPADEDESDASPLLGTTSTRGERELRRMLFAAPEDDAPSFGTGGLLDAAYDVISPAR